MSSVFTQIMQGNIPGHFVLEDDLCVAIMTIAPKTRGHVMVIPRDEIDHWDDVPSDLMGHMMAVSRRIAKALKQCFRCERVGVLLEGLEVPHTHIHLIPISAPGDMDLSHSSADNDPDLAATATLIAGQLKAAE